LGFAMEKPDWIVLREALDDLKSKLKVKRRTIKKYIRQLQNLGILEAKYAGLRPRLKYVKTVATP